VRLHQVTRTQPGNRSVPDGLARPIRFAVVGVANTLVDVAVFATLIASTATPPMIANVAGYSAGIVNSYLLNRNWTFSDSRGFAWRRELTRFITVNMAAMGLSTFVVWALTHALGPLPAKIVSLTVTFAFSYSLSRSLVFRPA
jgi:putative flippase GtrA